LEPAPIGSAPDIGKFHQGIDSARSPIQVEHDELNLSQTPKYATDRYKLVFIYIDSGSVKSIIQINHPLSNHHFHQGRKP
jgi:hypothetical protein